MKHGETKTKHTKVGSGHIYQKRICFCVVHGEIDLLICADWEAVHGRCNQPDKPRGSGLTIPEAIKKAA